MVPLAIRILDMNEVILMTDKTGKVALSKEKGRSVDKPIARAYPVIDNDLARDNMENDMPAADLEDL